MRARTKTLFKNARIVFMQHTKPGNAGKYYTIKVNFWGMTLEYKDEVRSHFDPAKNRGGTTGNTWKFRNKKDAEQLLMTALMRWPV